MVTGCFKSGILNTCGLKELEKEKRDIEQNKYRSHEGITQLKKLPRQTIQLMKRVRDD